MKRLWSGLSVLALVLVITAVDARAQQINWEIKQHDNPDTFLDDVTAKANEGYAPLGFTFRDETFYVLYVNGAGIEMSGIGVRQYDSFDKVKDGLTAEMEDGYMPTGIAHTGDLFFILYVKTPHTATAWQLVTSEIAGPAIEAAINEWTEQRYYPVGITAYDDTWYTLLVQSRETNVQSWSLNSFKADVQTLQSGINSKIEEGYVPFGLTYLEDEVQILFVSTE
jgi:hypothetical protein